MNRNRYYDFDNPTFYSVCFVCTEKIHKKNSKINPSIHRQPTHQKVARCRRSELLLPTLKFSRRTPQLLPNTISFISCSSIRNTVTNQLTNPGNYRIYSNIGCCQVGKLFLQATTLNIAQNRFSFAIINRNITVRNELP